MKRSAMLIHLAKSDRLEHNIFLFHTWGRVVSPATESKSSSSSVGLRRPVFLPGSLLWLILETGPWMCLCAISFWIRSRARSTSWTFLESTAVLKISIKATVKKRSLAWIYINRIVCMWLLMMYHSCIWVELTCKGQDIPKLEILQDRGTWYTNCVPACLYLVSQSLQRHSQKHRVNTLNSGLLANAKDHLGLAKPNNKDLLKMSDNTQGRSLTKTKTFRLLGTEVRVDSMELWPSL